MRVLLLHGQNNTKVSSRANRHYNYVLQDGDSIVELEKLHLHDIDSGKKILEQALNYSPHDIVHIWYDRHLFASGSNAGEQIELFAWLLQHIKDRGSETVVSFPTENVSPLYYVDPKLSWLKRKSFKWVNDEFYKLVLPLLNQCNVVVDTYFDEKILQNIGVKNIHVIPQPVIEEIDLIKTYKPGEALKMVIPGDRSENIDYAACFKLLKAINPFIPSALHICDRQDTVPDDKLISLMFKHEVDVSVQFVTFPKQQEEYLNQLTTYDIALLPGKQVTQDLLDAVNAGLVCIASKTQKNEDFKTQHNCIYTTDRLEQSGKFYIDRLYFDQVERERIATNIEKYKDRVSVDNVQHMYENVYQPRIKVKDEECPSSGTVNVFMCCRDNERDLGVTLSRLKTMERDMFWCDFKYYVLENDSADDTPNLIKDFFAHSSGNYECIVLDKEKHASVASVNRMRDMADYRNQMKELCTEWSGSNYSFIVDSGVNFDTDTMDRQIKYMEKNPDVAMVTPYGLIQTSDTYYDNFAYRNLQDTRDFDPPSMEKPFEANSAFCGFVCIRTPILERCNWDMVDGDTCEHVSFCKQVRKHGKIMIDPTVIVRWRP